MEIIQHIIKTMNLIEVRGADNLDRLLACIQTLERFDKALEEKGNADDNYDEQAENVSSAVG